MTDWRNELIKDVTNAMYKVENMQCSKLLVMARAALAVAEPVIREQADNALREESARLRELVVSAREENARLRNDNFEWLQQLSATNHQLEKEQKEIQKLRRTLIGVLAGFVASVELLERGGKKAAPSDKMFAQMLKDYKNRIERGRAAVAAIREGGT
jgi:hypothetical protein